MIRVAHMFDGTMGGGVFRMLDMLLKYMDRTRFQPVVFVSQSGVYTDMLRDAGFEIRVLGNQTQSLMGKLLSARSLDPFAYARLYREMRREAAQLARLLEKENVDILHTHHHDHHLLGGMATRRSLPTVWHVHAIVNPRAMFGLQWRIFNHFARKYASHLVAVSSSVREDLAPKVREKTTVVNNGIELGGFALADPAEARKRLGFSAGEQVVGMVGRFSTLKGVPDFIRMAANLSAHHPRTKYVIVGVSESDRERSHQLTCIQQIEALGLQERVVIRDSLKDPALFMAGLDILVHPTTTYEGFGLVVLEAHAAGRPVVCTDCGGPRDIIVDGVTGFIVPRGDCQAMAQRVSKLLEDDLLRATMGEAARRRAGEDRFQIVSTVRRIEALYTALILPTHATSQECTRN